MILVAVSGFVCQFFRAARPISLCLLEEVDKIASLVRTLGVLRSTYDLLAVYENFTGLNNQRSEITCSLAFVTA